MRISVFLLLLLLAPHCARSQTDDSRPRRTDAGVGGMVDPTKNVLDLVEAAIRRQDDLRKAEAEKVGIQIAQALKLMDFQDAHIKEVAALSRAYEEQLRVAESKRVDTVRTMDAAAVQEQNRKATETATTLASNVNTSAEALRALVSTTTSAQNAASQQVINTLNARIAVLEQASYTSAGKATYVDPQITMIITEIRSLNAAQSAAGGKEQGAATTWAAVSGIAGLLLGAFGAFVAVNRRAQIQHIYAPTPPQVQPLYVQPES